MPQIGQYALIKNDKKQLLVLQRIRTKKWCLPGGRIHQDENWEESFKREVKEEAGLDPTEYIPITVQLVRNDFQTKYCVYFSTKVHDARTVTVEEGHASYAWADPEMLAKLSFEDKKVQAIALEYLTSS